MFEEEAEEYKDNTRIKDKNTYIGFPDERISELQDYEGNYIDISERIIKTFKDGAEFGYNKAKEEMQEQGLALQSDMDKTIEQNIQLKKQNNWLEGCKLELAEHLGKANDKISELEQQIEKMKCCGNCKYSAQETVYSIVCKVGGVNKGEIENVEDCLVCDKWEIKENE